MSDVNITKPKRVMIVLSIVLVMVITLIMTVITFLSEPDVTGETVIVEIPKGAGMMTIARLLEEKGVVKSARGFAALAKVKGVSKKLQAGEYKFDIGTPYEKVLDRMLKGKVLLRQFTIPEGYNIYQIAPLLSKNGFGNSEAILMILKDEKYSKSLNIPSKGLEGYLFPETYSYVKGESLQRVLRRMVVQFFKVYNEESKTGSLSKNLDMNELVTLASICEKEAVIQKELPLIAGVYLNRLAINMPLQADPTVIYGLKNFDRLLSRKDLAFPTPYNTYLNKNLPPGPIACPGRMAIRAVFNPEKTKAIYFVAKNDGSHHFSQTYPEHLNAIRKYRR